MKLTLHVWRQKSPNLVGRMVQYEHAKVSPHMSFLEMLDVLNEELTAKGEEPVAFDHDCREGICGSCGFMINGVAPAPQPGRMRWRLHWRHLKAGDVLDLGPWRAKPFHVVKHLVVGGSSFDRIIGRGAFISASKGAPAVGNAAPVPKRTPV